MTSSLDDAFRALSNPERRQLLLALSDHNPQSDSSIDYPDGLPFEDRKDEKLLSRMHHAHLPMLEESGFVEWHEDDRQITMGPNFEVVRPLLQILDRELDEDANREGAKDAL